ncbi:MAG TPA: GerAB/ArcD/ProY family transporter [Selenomonadales bacterium]|nr:GerAB/ArcD/ProY family transporter [Selenomonadales bacterium]
MSFHPGRMGMAEGIGLTFLVTFPRIFLTTPAISVDAVKNLAWATPLIAFAADLAVFYMLFYAQARLRGDLFSQCEQCFGRPVAWLVAIFYAAVFMLDATLLLRQFAENTLLTALPYADFRFVIIWYAFFVVILVYFGIEGLARASYLMLPWIIFSIFLVLALAAPFYDPYNLLPWQGAGVGEAAKRGLLLAGLNIGGVLLPILGPQFQTVKTQKVAFVLGAGGSTVVRSVMVAGFILAFGVAEAGEKTLPFFELSRLVYLSRYIQRIEATFIIIWVIVGILSIAINIYMALYLIARPLKLPSLRPLVPVMAMIVVNMAILPPDVMTVAQIDSMLLTTLFNFGIVVVPLALFLAVLIRRKRRRLRCHA